jgi:hypothetical protein
MVLSDHDWISLRQLVDRGADAIDRRDEGEFVALFTPDGVMRVRPAGGEVENEWSGARLADSFQVLRAFHRTFHHVGGAVFAATDEGASGRIHCAAHHYERTSNGPVDLVMMIVYLDGYVRIHESWLIAERTVEIQWTELHPAHPARRRRGPSLSPSRRPGE